MMMLPVAGQTGPPMEPGARIALPEAAQTGVMSLAEALAERRSAPDLERAEAPLYILPLGRLR